MVPFIFNKMSFSRYQYCEKYNSKIQDGLGYSYTRSNFLGVRIQDQTKQKVSWLKKGICNLKAPTAKPHCKTSKPLLEIHHFRTFGN